MASPRTFAGILALAASLCATAAGASEAELKIPDLGSVSFLGMSGHNLLLFGLIVCIGGMVFGLVQYMQIRKLPVHQAMLEISDLIYETCKTYLITQGKFLAILWAFIAVIMVVYFGFLLGFS
ncbi:MAG TPA: sodium/proton-translocating pyrophosphatase, partial [Candidatus Methylomirabilis sp.]|nr:sodium/proton-translocating pyrophosphatase [Candidatus Methylomirabilis sp.]